VLLATVQRHGVVRLFSTLIQGTLGTETEVELSAAGDADVTPHHFGILLRAVGQRLPKPAPSRQAPSLSGMDNPQIGKAPLRKLVQQAIGAVERDYIEATLDLTGGNRTAAAELLGLSRQSLYAKINRYQLNGSGKVSVGSGNGSR
jgi:DNA-binding NtrC family response regulator